MSSLAFASVTQQEPPPFDQDTQANLNPKESGLGAGNSIRKELFIRAARKFMRTRDLGSFDEVFRILEALSEEDADDALTSLDYETLDTLALFPGAKRRVALCDVFLRGAHRDGGKKSSESETRVTEPAADNPDQYNNASNRSPVQIGASIGVQIKNDYSAHSGIQSSPLAFTTPSRNSPGRIGDQDLSTVFCSDRSWLVASREHGTEQQEVRDLRAQVEQLQRQLDFVTGLGDKKIDQERIKVQRLEIQLEGERDYSAKLRDQLKACRELEISSPAPRKQQVADSDAMNVLESKTVTENTEIRTVVKGTKDNARQDRKKKLLDSWSSLVLKVQRRRLGTALHCWKKEVGSQQQSNQLGCMLLQLWHLNERRSRNIKTICLGRWKQCVDVLVGNILIRQRHIVRRAFTTWTKHSARSTLESQHLLYAHFRDWSLQGRFSRLQQSCTQVVRSVKLKNRMRRLLSEWQLLTIAKAAKEAELLVQLSEPLSFLSDFGSVTIQDDSTSETVVTPDRLTAIPETIRVTLAERDDSIPAGDSGLGQIFSHKFWFGESTDQTKPKDSISHSLNDSDALEAEAPYTREIIVL